MHQHIGGIRDGAAISTLYACRDRTKNGGCRGVAIDGGAPEANHCIHTVFSLKCRSSRMRVTERPVWLFLCEYRSLANSTIQGGLNMRKIMLGLSAAVVGAFIGFSASAAPMTPVAPSDSGLVKAHGWHFHCDWDRRGHHRHVPGVGRVPCRDGHWRDDRRDDRRGDSCRHHRHRCADRWGWGNWEFRRCLRRHGC